MFRSVSLPADVPGTLYLHSMPGRREAFSAACAAIAANRVARVVCLAPLEEIREKSPEYARAIEAGLPFQQVSHPIADYGIPADMKQFADLASSVASVLRHGENALVHCAAGIGRTGMMAIAILLALNVPLDDAQQRVRSAGSGAETPVQRAFIIALNRRV